MIVNNSLQRYLPSYWSTYIIILCLNYIHKNMKKINITTVVAERLKSSATKPEVAGS